MYYEVFYKGYKTQNTYKIGELIERRNESRVKRDRRCGLKYARMVYGSIVKDPHAIFIEVRV